MYSKTVKIINDSGLHARPAAEFVREAGKYKSMIHIHRVDRPERNVNAKSMVLVLSLGACKDAEVNISAVGEDEHIAVEALVDQIKGGFGER